MSPLASAVTQELTQAQATVTVQGQTIQQAVVLPYPWDKIHNGQSGEATFALRFALPAATTRLHAIYMPKVGNTYSVWLNGVLMSSMSDEDDTHAYDYAKAPQYITIPAQILLQDNLLTIHVRSEGGRRGGLSAVFVGPVEEVRDLFQHDWRWRMTGSSVVVIFSMLVGSMAFSLWWTQSGQPDPRSGRRDALYLAAAAAELFWALRVVDVGLEKPPLPWPIWGVVFTAAFAGWICCSAFFCHRVAGWHLHPRAVWFNAWLLLLFVSSIVASALAFTLQQPILLTAWLGCANLFFVGYAITYLYAAIRNPSKARVLVAVAGGINVVMGVRDWLMVRIVGSYETFTWIRYSSVLFGLVLGYIVLTRFREASSQARDLVANLADRVAEKEQALRLSYGELEQLSKEETRRIERTRILQDMHDGVGSHISVAMRQLQSGKATEGQVLQTLRESLDHLKLSIDAINAPPGDLTALLANMRYRLEPRLKAADVLLQWHVDEIAPLVHLDNNALRQLQFMVYEALSNVLQHAHAKTVRIELTQTPQGVRLRVVDDGCGFDIASVQARGLAALQARALAIGGQLSVTSCPGETVVAIVLP